MPVFSRCHAKTATPSSSAMPNSQGGSSSRRDALGPRTSHFARRADGDDGSQRLATPRRPPRRRTHAGLGLCRDPSPPLRSPRTPRSTEATLTHASAVSSDRGSLARTKAIDRRLPAVRGHAAPSATATKHDRQPNASLALPIMRRLRPSRGLCHMRTARLSCRSRRGPRRRARPLRARAPSGAGPRASRAPCRARALR